MTSWFQSHSYRVITSTPIAVCDAAGAASSVTAHLCDALIGGWPMPHPRWRTTAPPRVVVTQPAPDQTVTVLLAMPHTAETEREFRARPNAFTRKLASLRAARARGERMYGQEFVAETHRVVEALAPLSVAANRRLLGDD